MDKAKCRVSHEKPQKDGTVRKFRAGQLYDLGELTEDQVTSYFEHPERAPSSELQKRKPAKSRSAD